MITFGTARSVSAEARVLAFAPLGRTLEVGPTRLFVAVVGARLVDLRLVKRNDDESHALKSVNRSIRLKPYDFSPSSVSVDSSRSAAAAEDDKEQKKKRNRPTVGAANPPRTTAPTGRTRRLDALARPRSSDTAPSIVTQTNRFRGGFKPPAAIRPHPKPNPSPASSRPDPRASASQRARDRRGHPPSIRSVSRRDAITAITPTAATRSPPRAKNEHPKPAVVRDETMKTR
jgi:hypothetical protein